MKTPDQLIDDLIALAFAEDIGDGDHTTLCCIPADEMGRSKLLVKEEGILAGVDVARRVFTAFDPSLEMEVFIEDGAHVKPGDVAFVVSGIPGCSIPARQRRVCAYSKKRQCV